MGELILESPGVLYFGKRFSILSSYESFNVIKETFNVLDCGPCDQQQRGVQVEGGVTMRLNAHLVFRQGQPYARR